MGFSGKEHNEERTEGREFYTGDATEILTRTQRIAFWLINMASNAKNLLSQKQHSFEESDRDYFYYGPSDGQE